jgi:hypothetical protein
MEKLFLRMIDKINQMETPVLITITFFCFDTNNNNVNLNIYGLISISNEETIYQEYLQAEITDENIDAIV